MDARSTSVAGIRFDHQEPLLLAFVGLVAVIVKGLGGMYAAYWQSRMAAEAGGALRLEVLDGWLAVHRLRQAGHPDHGRLKLHPSSQEEEGTRQVGPQARGVAALTLHVREVEQGLGAGLLGGGRAVAQLIPLALACVWIAPRLAAAALLLLVPFALLMTRTRRRWKRACSDASHEADALLEAADDAVRHADLWTAFGAERKVRSHVASLGGAIARQTARLEATSAGLSFANEALGACALVAALFAARLGWLGEAGSGGVLLSFTVAFFLAYRPLRELTEARLAIARARVAFDELHAALPDRELPEAPPASAKSWPLATLELRDVRPARGYCAPVSISAPPGSIVALSGPTGIGKTTLLRTLLGLEAPAGGQIRYAGSELNGAPPGPGARPFVWVPQDAPMLGGTLAANVGLGGAVDPRDPLELLGASHLIEELGSARLGIGGRTVSGGERQWISLARAIATRQPVLLLDEPTSGLDAASQAKVLEAIARLRGRRTVVLVTHRPEPLTIADTVVCVEPHSRRSPMP